MKLSKFAPYAKLMRLHQPTGIFLLLWPCLISLAMVNKGYLDLKLTLVFIIGSILMRGAGCIINDLVDRDLDKNVERTKNRPLASREITADKAMKFLVLLLLLSASLLFFLKPIAIMISIASLFLIVLYPYCKRFTYWPQICLGLVFNIGVLIAWTTVRGNLSLPPIILYICFVFWTIGYDTIYAHQDRLDDLMVGIKSTAIKFGNKTDKYLNWLYTLVATFFLFAGSSAGMPYMFYTLSSVPIALLFWQVNRLDINDPANCAASFKMSKWIGGLMFLAVIGTRLV